MLLLEVLDLPWLLVKRLHRRPPSSEFSHPHPRPPPVMISSSAIFLHPSTRPIQFVPCKCKIHHLLLRSRKASYSCISPTFWTSNLLLCYSNQDGFQSDNNFANMVDQAMQLRLILPTEEHRQSRQFHQEWAVEYGLTPHPQRLLQLTK